MISLVPAIVSIVMMVALARAAVAAAKVFSPAQLHSAVVVALAAGLLVGDWLLGLFIAWQPVLCAVGLYGVEHYTHCSSPCSLYDEATFVDTARPAQETQTQEAQTQEAQSEALATAVRVQGGDRGAAPPVKLRKRTHRLSPGAQVYTTTDPRVASCVWAARGLVCVGATVEALSACARGGGSAAHFAAATMRGVALAALVAIFRRAARQIGAIRNDDATML